ncbi:hypothetical protein BC827DRAFT_29334 [Russula dissimulans]|nr:hypothetical protein BC827DRAFT_29334 [Russula dissimulans]
MKSTFHNTTFEKRHTKPCRFFQKGNCPLSADRCDFAHVKIQILPVRYSYGHVMPSQETQYDNREGHPLAAPVDIGMQKAVTLHAVPGNGEDVVTIVQPAHVHSQTMRRMTHPLVAAAPAKVPYVSRLLYPQQAVLLPPVSARSPVANVLSSVSMSSEDITHLIIRGGGGDSSPTSDVPSLSDGDSDPPSAACEAPELAERWPGSPSVPSPFVYYNPSPGLFSPGVPYTPPIYGPWTSPKQATRSESRRHGMSTRKLRALKTKQCKFFKKDGRCPQGNLCTFIHDPSVLQSSKSDQESPSDSSCDSPEVYPKSESQVDDDHGQNIYPITWRVIGGGVMMGGRRKACARYKDGVCSDGDDCPYTHTSEDDTETTPIESASSATSTPRASYFPQVEMRAGADKSARQSDTPPTPELIPVSPVAARGCGPPSILGVREELPPRPFSTPPRISSRAEAAAQMKT